MADIVIRGMEMPENCGECVFLRKLEKATPYTSRFWCCIKGNAVLKHEKSKYCPLVPLPEGHGRLIDGGAIVAEMEKQETERDTIMELCKRVGDMKNYFRCSNNQTEIVSFMRMLNNAPTIVPAEGGEKNVG